MNGTKYAASLHLKRDDSGSLKVALVFPERKSVVCPCCSGSLNDKGKLYECECGFKLWKTIAGKTLTDNQLKSLIETGQTSEIKGFVGKSNKAFNAKLKIDVENKQVKFEF